MRKIWLLALVAALLTTACRIETNVLIDLNADGTGSFGFEFGMDDEFRQLIAAEGGGFDLDDIFGGLGGDLPGATFTERTEGDMMFTVFTVDFDGAGEFQELIAAGAGTGGDIDVQWTEDSVAINATLEGTGGDGGLDLLGDAGGDFGDFDLGASFAESFFSGSVIVGMPGEVTSHNADRVLSDGRLQWDLSLDGSDVEISAVSDLSGGGGFPAWVLLLMILLALAIILWLFSVQRRRTAIAAIEATAVTTPGEASPAPADWSTPAPPAEEGNGPENDASGGSEDGGSLEHAE